MPETEGPSFRRSTLAERQEIEWLLDANASMSEIARTLGRSVSTITREITRNRRDDGYRVSPVSITRLCVHVRTCQVKGVCKGCWNRRCAGCRDVRCTNTCYTERLEEAGAVASVGSKRDSYDNALAETINGLYKTEVIRRKGPWRCLEDVEFATLEWVHWFNNHRLLEPIGDIPPAEFEGIYWLEQAANDTVGVKETGLQ